MTFHSSFFSKTFPSHPLLRVPMHHHQQQLPFVLTRTLIKGSTSFTASGCWDTFWLNLFRRTSLNSYLSFSSLPMLSSSISFFHCSLRVPINSTNYCGLIDVEVLETHDACPKYWEMVTSIPINQTQPGCFSRPMTIVNIS